MNKKIIATFVFVGFVVIPLIINVIGTKITIKSSANFGDWLGFWGSYLGGFVTLVGVYFAFLVDDQKDKRQSVVKNAEGLESTLRVLRNIQKNIQFNDVTSSDLKKHYNKLSRSLKEMPTLHFEIYMKLKHIERLTFLANYALGMIDPYQILLEYSAEEKLEENSSHIEDLKDNSNEVLRELQEEIQRFENCILKYMYKI